MFVRHKPHPFGNDRHTIDCELSTIIWFAEIVGGRGQPRERRRPEFDDIGKTLGKMLRCTRPIWKCAMVVIMDSVFCVIKGFVELWKKGIFGAAVIKKHRNQPTNFKGDATNDHFAPKEVGNVDAVKQVEYGLAYHVFCTKDPDYVIKLITAYRTLEPTDKRTRRKLKHGDVMEKRQFMYTEVVANYFLYQHQIDDNNNRGHAPISIEKTWATKYWPDRCFAWYLAVSEVNENYD